MTGQTPIAVTMGEPAGIGGELTLAAWRRGRSVALPPYFVIDDPDRLAALAAHLGLDIPVRVIGSAAEAGDAFSTALPVLPVDMPVRTNLGQPSADSAQAVVASIDRGVALCQSGEARALVTQPIQKEVLYQAGFNHPGHTEHLAHLCGENLRPVMMLACRALKVVPVTIHQSLVSVAATLTPDLIADTLVIAAEALHRDFGIKEPRIAVAGLNPHAGEGGRFGCEETTIIGPAIDMALARLKSAGPADAGATRIRGPLSADTLFHPAGRARYDAAVCMYHDQALIPIKTIDFDHGVNVTLGLPIVRTSPDHGTALDIAGQGVASADSFVEALLLAAEIGRRRSGAST